MADHKWSDDLLLKIVNILVTVFLITSSSYSAADAGYYGGKETYIHPSHWTFLVWGLIHILLVIMMVWQFFSDAYDTVVERVGWKYPLLGILQGVWVWLWVRNHYILAFIASLLVSSAVSAIYYSVKEHHGKSIHDDLWVHLPFSLWHGWIVVIILISAFAAFGISTDTSPGVATQILVVLAMFILEAIAVGYAFYPARGDVAGSAVIAWALLGIFTRQHAPVIHWFALAFFIISLINIAKAIRDIQKGGRGLDAVLHSDEEARPILGQ